MTNLHIIEEIRSGTLWRIEDLPFLVHVYKFSILFKKYKSTCNYSFFKLLQFNQ